MPLSETKERPLPKQRPMSKQRPTTEAEGTAESWTRHDREPTTEEPVRYPLTSTERPRGRLSRRTTLRLGAFAGGTLLIGGPTLAGTAAGQPEEEEEEEIPVGLFTKFKHNVADFDKGVIVFFDGDVSDGEPDDRAYLEAEAEVEPTEMGVIVQVTAGGFRETRELEQDPPETVIFVDFDSTTIGARIGSDGTVTEFSGTSDDVAAMGVIIQIVLEGVGTSPGIAALDLSVADDGPRVE